jgi:hypothetical protein
MTDQERKLNIVLITTLWGLLGFVLECGPVGGVFGLALSGPPVTAGFTVELQSFGFLAYLALAAAVTLGLHLGEAEPTLREPTPDELRRDPEAGPVADRTFPRVRPELHQLRIMATALLGFTALKLVSLAWMSARFEDIIGIGGITRLFEFGLVYIALGWFLFWQFAREYAASRQWARMVNELMGGTVSKAVAVVALVKPLWYIVAGLRDPRLLAGTVGILTLALHLSLVLIAVVLWTARPTTLRRTLYGLEASGGVVLVLTVLLAIVEQQYHV